MFVLAVFLLTAIGITVVNPNESSVLVLFVAYKGTIKSNGFFRVNPFFVRKKISLRARNFESDTIKVNDKTGNPIKISCVLVCKVEEKRFITLHINKVNNTAGGNSCCFCS